MNERLLHFIRHSPVLLPRKPWSARAMIYTDGITNVSFTPFSEDLLVVSVKNKNWLISCSDGYLVSRDYEVRSTKEVVASTEDGFKTDIVHVEGFDLAVLVEPGINSFTRYTKIYQVEKILRWGFSPSGKTLVFATNDMVCTYVRD